MPSSFSFLESFKCQLSSFLFELNWLIFVPEDSHQFFILKLNSVQLSTGAFNKSRSNSFVVNKLFPLIDSFQIKPHPSKINRIVVDTYYFFGQEGKENFFDSVICSISIDGTMFLHFPQRKQIQEILCFKCPIEFVLISLEFDLIVVTDNQNNLITLSISESQQINSIKLNFKPKFLKITSHGFIIVVRSFKINDDFHTSLYLYDSQCQLIRNITFQGETTSFEVASLSYHKCFLILCLNYRQIRYFNAYSFQMFQTFFQAKSDISSILYPKNQNFLFIQEKSNHNIYSLNILK